MAETRQSRAALLYEGHNRINQALLWVGTPGNTVWGDNSDDLGVAKIDELSIRVFEYPTPQPSGLTLFAAAACIMLGRCQSHRCRA